MPEREAIMHGKRLTAICDDRGIEVGKVRDERHGKINSYPEEVVREYFAVCL